MPLPCGYSYIRDSIDQVFLMLLVGKDIITIAGSV